VANGHLRATAWCWNVLFQPGKVKTEKMAARDTLTKNQQKVLHRLEVATGPLSAYTLLDKRISLFAHGFR